MKKDKNSDLSKLPQVESVLQHPALKALVDKQFANRQVLTNLVRESLSNLRSSTPDKSKDISAETVAELVLIKWNNLFKHKMTRVVNGTGVILNTNLGRAPLSPAIADEVSHLITGYCDLEYDIDSGKRSNRNANVSRLIQVLTGAEAAIVVNNNAAAVMLAISALAQAKEVIVSRSELIEIGGSFRIPDVISSAGAKLKEVGATNKSRLSDFASAISADTACLLKCHQSNFKIIGFTDEVAAKELSILCKENNIPFLHDLGSGSLINIEQMGLEHEPTVQECIKEGADLVMFSADKLLGGGQAGIIAGRKDLVTRVANHPIYRAIRCDKLNIAILESVLMCYLKSNSVESMPALKMASHEPSHIKERVENFLASLPEVTRKKFTIQIVETTSILGGGSLPGQSLSSFGLALTGDGGLNVNSLARRLRNNCTPVISLTQKDRVIIDFRTVLASDEPELLSAINKLSDNSSGYNEPV